MRLLTGAEERNACCLANGIYNGFAGVCLYVNQEFVMLAGGFAFLLGGVFFLLGALANRSGRVDKMIAFFAVAGALLLSATGIYLYANRELLMLAGGFAFLLGGVFFLLGALAQRR
ncbi:MAG: hypothetical protein OXU43_05690 [Gammaproteobacteria bacterium]|nr:hypothetical protein [Gammaproteobacteria bacterium]